MARFDSTQWSLVLQAREGTPDARMALDRLCRVYRPPVVAYIRGRGYASEAAEVQVLKPAILRPLERR